MRCANLILAVLTLAGLSCRKDVDLAMYEARVSYYRNITESKHFDSVLTMMTYNIQCAFAQGGDPWNKDNKGGTPEHLAKLAAFIDSTGADIVALQEVPLDRYNIVIKHFLDSLATRMHMNYAFGAHGYNDAYGSGYPVVGQWGVAILSRYPITEIESREVSYLDVWTRRSTLRARLQLNSTQSIDVYSLHHKPMYDRSDLEKTGAFVKESTLPKLVAGDFNAMPDVTSPYFDLNRALPDSLGSIDQIFCSPAFKRQYAGVGGHGLSDHEALWVSLVHKP